MRKPVMLMAALALAACQKASDSTEPRKRPNLPPPPVAHAPAELRIEIEIDGQAMPPLDNAALERKASDFADSERRAWRLSTLLGAPFARPGAVAAVVGDKDATLLLRAPKKAGDPEPVLAVSRRGEIVAALVSAKDPFPNYHDQGRRLHRQGDPLPRLFGVKKIRVYVEK